jgi:wyosine [tRNA(Phe)-imidazoG37] synthetase (radical SAM superfamily)
MIHTREKTAMEKIFRYFNSSKDIPDHQYNRTPPVRVNGTTLEIDLIPEKTCPADCCYCPYKTTSKKTLDRERFFTAGDIMQKVTGLYRTSSVKQIILTGCGEPTLNADLFQILYAIKNYTPTPVILKSCGGLLWRESVRHDCMLADTVHVNIDVADKKAFSIINKFLLMIPFDRYIEGIIHFRQFFKGNFIVNVTLLHGMNTHPGHLDKLSKLIRYLDPTEVNVRTVTNSDTGIVPVSRDSLHEFASRFDRMASVADPLIVSHHNQEFEYVK